MWKNKYLPAAVAAFLIVLTLSSCSSLTSEEKSEVKGIIGEINRTHYNLRSAGVKTIEFECRSDLHINQSNSVHTESLKQVLLDIGFVVKWDHRANFDSKSVRIPRYDNPKANHIIDKLVRAGEDRTSGTFQISTFIFNGLAGGDELGVAEIERTQEWTVLKSHKALNGNYQVWYVDENLNLVKVKIYPGKDEKVDVSYSFQKRDDGIKYLDTITVKSSIPEKPEVTIRVHYNNIDGLTVPVKFETKMVQQERTTEEVITVVKVNRIK